MSQPINQIRPTRFLHLLRSLVVTAHFKGLHKTFPVIFYGNDTTQNNFRNICWQKQVCSMQRNWLTVMLIYYCFITVCCLHTSCCGALIGPVVFSSTLNVRVFQCAWDFFSPPKWKCSSLRKLPVRSRLFHAPYHVRRTWGPRAQNRRGMPRGPHFKRMQLHMFTKRLNLVVNFCLSPPPRLPF